MESYGDEGYKIISAALFFLFPLGSFDLTPFGPISWNLIISEILLPETAVSLIQQDLKLPREDAIKAMRESQRMGSHLHPGDDSEHVDNAIRRANNSVKSRLD
jgi:hypothetical protein